jgi:DNA ligase (NAD+)
MSGRGGTVVVGAAVVVVDVLVEEVLVVDVEDRGPVVDEADARSGADPSELELPQAAGTSARAAIIRAVLRRDIGSSVVGGRPFEGHADGRSFHPGIGQDGRRQPATHTQPMTNRYPTDTEPGYLAAVEALQTAAKAYYSGEGLEAIGMTDVDYDRILDDIQATEIAFPEWTVDHGLYGVAAGTAPVGDVKHSTPMLSLGKTTDVDGLTAWWDRLCKLVASETPEIVVEPKLDGIAISATYEPDGQGGARLVRVVTRGDGTAGEDVTAKVPSGTVGLPRTVQPADTGFEVRGELVFTAEQFAAANTFRLGEGKAAFVNARNALAGSVRRDDLDVDERPAMTFFAYSVVGGIDAPHLTQMLSIRAKGFNPAAALTRAGACTSLAEVVASITNIETLRPTLGVDIDGAVIKANLPEQRDAAGANGSHPRWALAWKYAAEEASTTLLDIEVQVGRTGIHSLRGRLEPVFVGGTTVTYATLHNPSDLIERDVRPGDTVVVRRAGDVIPEIAGHIARPDGSQPWVMPTECVKCGTDLDQSEKRWRCVNRDCIAGAGALLVYACSRDALDIEGAAEGTVATIIGANLARNLPQLAKLTPADLMALDGFAEVSATNLVANIEAAKAQPLHRLVTALGIRMTGRRMSKRIAAHFGTLDAIRSADTTALCEVEGIGDRRAEVIRAELDALAPLLDELTAQGWNTLDENYGVAKADPADLPLSGETVVVTGSVPGFDRTGVTDLIERLGGKSSGSVSKNTTILVSAGPGSSKHTKAEQLGIRIETPEWLADLAATI